MSLMEKFTFLREKSEKWGKKSVNKTNLVYNPYKNKLQRSEVSHRPNKNFLQTLFSTGGTSNGDEHFGHNIFVEPKRHNTRFLAYNPNGLPYKDDIYLTQLLRRCLELNVHYCGFSEINVNTNNTTLRNRMKTAAEKFLQNGLFHMANSFSHGGAVEFQPGGVASWFHGRLNNKFLGVSYDSRGRWISHHFQGGKRNLKVYTLYRVNNSSSKPGSGSAWEQQRLLLEKSKIFTNPRQQVIVEFLEVLKQDLHKGFSLLVLSDLNEGIADNEGTNQKFYDLGLINILEEKYKHLPKTHKEGSKAIDHIWGTSDVVSNVEACGYAPFNAISFSDHRGVFVDINLQNLLPEHEIKLPQVQCRTLKSTNPRRVKDYNKLLKQRWDHGNIDAKWKIIKANIQKTGNTPSNSAQVNKLDQLISDFMHQSEEKVTKVSSPMNNEWSEKLHHAAQLVNEWSYRVRQALRLTKQGSVNKKDITYCREECTLARQNLRGIREESKKYRKEFQNEQAEALNVQMKLLGQKGSNYIKLIKNTESQTNQYARIQKVLSQKYSKAIQCIWIPDILAYPEDKRKSINIYDIDVIWERVHVDDGRDIENWKPIDNKFMIEKMLLQWQRKHFSQASETPLTTTKWLHWLSDPEIQRQILDGTFEGEEDLPYETGLFLNYMIRSTPEKINHTTTFEEFTAYIRKARESTACSPSGRHYGHYKALQMGNVSILYTIYDIFQTSLNAGIILDRWSKTVTTLIEKKKGLPYLHKFRTIHIVEAELQFFTKVIYARRMMSHAEKCGEISDDQYGGRKQRQATSVILNKCMYYAISKQTLKTAAYMDDDAKACYDRVIPQLSEIESQKWGLTYKAANLATRIIQSQRFYVRTGFGVSDTYYSYEKSNPIFGVGQGLGWSGPMWLNTSDTINKVINKKCGGMRFESFDKSEVVEKKNDMFVDDTASGVTEDCVFGDKTVVEQLEEDEQLHASLMFSAGHRLASQKCLWYIVKYKRKGSDYTFLPKDDLEGTLRIKEGFHIAEKTVKRLEPDEAHKTLGHWIAPTGNDSKQKVEIRKKVDTWSTKMANAKLLPGDTQVAYNAFLLPALKYKIVSTNLSFDECDEMMVRVKEILLNAHGMHKNCSRNILFQPTENMGLGYSHWYHVKGFEKLKLFLLHSRRRDTTSKLLQISLSYTQMEAGSVQPILSTEYSKWGKYVTQTWLTDLWKFMGDCNVNIEVQQGWKYKPPRTNDRFLIELIEDSSLDDDKKKILNQVRIYLKILTLSDMVIINKKSTILPQIISAETSRPSYFNWPKTLKMEPKWKKIWHSFITSHVKPHLDLFPLGSWSFPTHQTWNIFTNPSQTCVNINGTSYLYENGVIHRENPVTNQLCLFPVDVFNDRIQGYSSFVPQLKFGEATRESLPAPEAWVERNRGIQMTSGIIHNLKQCIRTNQCVGVSDGSLRAGLPSHAWCLANKDTGTILMRGCAPIDGVVEKISSYRAEAFGLLAMVDVCHHVFKDPTMRKYRVNLYSDGDSVIRMLRQPIESRSKYMLQNDIDVVLELKRRVNMYPQNILIHYVPGHQDDHYQFEDLPILQRLNVIADEDVRKFIESSNPNDRTPIFPSLSNSVAWIQGSNGILSHDIERTMIGNYYAKGWEDYSAKKYNITSEINGMIDHKNIGHVLRSDRKGKSQSVKILHDVQFTSVMRSRWGLSSDTGCPLCDEKVDSTSHYYTCSHKLMREKKAQIVRNLRKSLIKKDTDPKLLQVIFQLFDIDKRITVEEFPSLFSLPYDLQLAVCEQIDIGTDLFKLGIISAKFGAYQNTMSSTSKTSQDQWIRHLIRNLFSISRELWSYRCKILHEENVETLDKLYRNELWNTHQQLRTQWWQFGPKDRQLLEMEKSFFEKGSQRNIDMWRQQVQVAQASSHFQASQNVKDIRTYFQVSKELSPVPGPRIKNSPIVPTQVMYRQLKLTKSPPREVIPRTNTKAKHGTKSRKNLTGSITKWLVRTNSRRKNRVGVVNESNGMSHTNPNSCVQKSNLLNKESISSCSAVPLEVDTRKIRYLIN